MRPSFSSVISSSVLKFCLGVALAGSVQNCLAVAITYEALDLADLVNGEDLWKYTYRVSGFNFQRNQGFTVYFDETRYRNLDSGRTPPNADWDVLTIQPDPLLGPGMYDALAVSGSPNASLTGEFSVSFQWLAGGVPGAQPFELYQLDNNGGFGLLEAGSVAPFVPGGGGGGGGGGTGVPEAGTNAFLLVMGTVALAGLRRAGLGK